MPARVVHPIKSTRGAGYGERINPVTGQREFHRGSDYSVPRKTPIYAPTDGTVVEGKDRAPNTVQGFGNWVWVDAQRTVGKDFIFGHLEHGDILVRRGDRVKAGDLIGYVGSAGQSTGPHLHFEVWGSPGFIGGEHLDPAAWLKRAGAVDPGTAPAPATTKTPAASVPSATKGATVATAADVQNELVNTADALTLYDNMSNEYQDARMRQWLKSVAAEMTFGEVADKTKDGGTGPTTMRGHVLRTAALARENNLLLRAIAAHLQLDVNQILGS
ncbi:M23 family metallopeptidase [Rhodococcus ruber]|uniref:M23 family metallopeptidase n=1 Tax=Rhodococcus ruber TaxID=1830 RepID=UPI003D818EAD